MFCFSTDKQRQLQTKWRSSEAGSTCVFLYRSLRNVAFSVCDALICVPSQGPVVYLMAPLPV
jgi:hypothetical protein